MKRIIFVFAILLFIAPECSHAGAGALGILDTTLQISIDKVVGQIETIAIKWLSLFVLIQFLFTNLGLLKSGADFEAIWGRFLGSLLWFTICFYFMEHGVDFIKNVSKQFFDIAGGIAGAHTLDAGYILGQGAIIAGSLISTVNDASGWTDLFLPSIIAGLVGCVILATCALIGFKIFLIKIETMLIVMLAPLSFAFLGLNALKDQGIAPFKSLVSLLYRIILIAVILSAMDAMSANLITSISSITDTSVDGVWTNLFAATLGFVLLGFLAFKSDSLAASLASGSTNLGTGDVASAAAMGAAAGAAVATGGLAAAGAATRPAQSMGDFIKSLGAGGQVTNASHTGAGFTPSGPAPTPPPSASMGPTNSRGVPIPPPSTQPSTMAGAGSGSAPSAPIDAAPAPTSPPSTSSPGSGVNAGISGAGNKLEENLGKLVDQLSQPKGAANPTLSDRMGTLNRHFEQEKAATHVSISTQNTD